MPVTLLPLVLVLHLQAPQPPPLVKLVLILTA
jgi:hypothetical protein